MTSKPNDTKKLLLAAIESPDPVIVLECLGTYFNSYTSHQYTYDVREEVSNDYETAILGKAKVLKSYEAADKPDLTIVTYGSMCRVIMEAAEDLAAVGISCEVIDAQTLLPFDIDHKILGSFKKTNRIVFIDEDVPGGACAYMFNKVMEEQGGYKFLDVSPRTITGQAHRPSYGTDGDYFSKPNVEDVVRLRQLV